MVIFLADTHNEIPVVYPQDQITGTFPEFKSEGVNYGTI